MPHKRALRSADTKLRLVEEKLGVGLWTRDLETSEVTWSPGLYRILGMDPATIVPSLDLYQSLVHPEDQVVFDNAIGLASETRLRNGRFRVIRPDGSMLWLQSLAQPHFDRSGRAIFMIGVIDDVTDEEELRASCDEERRYSRIVASLLGGSVWRSHPDGKLIETAEWTKLTGQTPQQAHDWDALAAIHPDDRAAFRESWRAAISGGREYKAKMRMKTVSGDYVRVVARGLPLRNAAGEIEQWIGHCTYHNGEAVADTGDRLPVPAQIRAARALLDWSAFELARHAGVSFSTIRRMEQSTDAIRAESLQKVQKTFESHGIAFSWDGAGGFGIASKPLS